MIAIVESIMSNIMGKRSNDDRNGVEISELGQLFYVLRLKHYAHMLGGI